MVQCIAGRDKAMQNLRALIIAIRDTGVTEQDQATVRRIRTINTVTLLATVITFCYCFFYVVYDLQHFRNEVIFLAIATSSYPLVFLLTRNDRPDAAMYLLVGIALTHLVVISRLLGVASGSLNYLLIIPFVLSLMIPEGDRISVWPFALATAAAFSFVTLGDYPGSTGQMSEQFRFTLLIANIFGAILLASGIAVFFRWLIHKAETELEMERERSDRLLHAILPDPIAQRLKVDGTDTVAERFDSATVLFADIVGFTRKSADIGPDKVVAELNRIFAHLDELARARGIEKIKTIGDAYFAVCGVPLKTKDHAERISDFALELEQFARSWESEVWPKLDFRVAIHTGPVVAGVIGRTKFAYDVWGDTVNTAARLEEKCTPGGIILSGATASRLPDRFSLKDLGRCELRDKGKMHVYGLVAG
jgi:adenylate cyclase